MVSRDDTALLVDLDPINIDGSTDELQDIVLRCVGSLRHPVTRGRLIAILMGQHESQISIYAHDHCVHFGSMSHVGIHETSRICDLLVTMGFLRTASDKHAMIELTETGKDRARGRVVHETPSSPPLRGDTPEEDSILQALRDFRKDQAKIHQVPDYAYLHDNALIEIARSKPDNLADLMALQRLPRKRMEECGAQIVQIILATRDSQSKVPLSDPCPIQSPQDITSQQAAACETVTTLPKRVAPLPSPVPIEKPITSRPARSLGDEIRDLLSKGTTLEQLSTVLGKPEPQVEECLLNLIRCGRISIDRLIPWEVREVIYRAMEKTGMSNTQLLSRMIGNQVPVSSIRYLQTALQQQPCNSSSQSRQRCPRPGQPK